MAYTTLANLKAYAGVTETGDDALLLQLIDRAQQQIDSYCGRTFESSADATRYFTVGEDTDGDTLYLDEDLCQITSIVTDADATSPVTLATTEYVTSPRNRTPYFAIRILSSSENIWTYTTDAENGIEVTGRWAWSVSAPDDIVHACTRLAAYYYKQKDAGVFDTTAIPDAGVIQVPQGIPQDVKIILSNYRKYF
jgi:hypothetical protein